MPNGIGFQDLFTKAKVSKAKKKSAESRCVSGERNQKPKSAIHSLDFPEGRQNISKDFK